MSPGLLNLLISAGATLVGAVAAFEPERQRRKHEEKPAQIGRLKQAMFTSIEQRNFAMRLKKQFLDPRRADPIRSFSLARAVRKLGPCGHAASRS